MSSPSSLSSSYRQSSRKSPHEQTESSISPISHFVYKINEYKLYLHDESRGAFSPLFSLQFYRPFGIFDTNPKRQIDSHGLYLHEDLHQQKRNLYIPCTIRHEIHKPWGLPRQESAFFTSSSVSYKRNS